MKAILCTLLAGMALGSSAKVEIREQNGSVTMKNDSIMVPLLKSRNFVVNFSDITASKPVGVLTMSQIWYHGRSGNTTHFYQDQAEPSWKLKNYQIKDNSVTAHTGNIDFDVSRTVTMFDDTPAIKLDYLLNVRETREFNRDNFPMFYFTKDIDSISYNKDAKLEHFNTTKSPGELDMTQAHAIFLHMPKSDRTILLMPDLNAPRKFGYKLGLAPFFRDLKWAKVINFRHLYRNVIDHYQKGEKLGGSFYFMILKGAALSEEHKKEARKLAERFKLEPPRFDLSELDREYRQPSALAGVLPGISGLNVWNESTMKKVYPRTNAPDQKFRSLTLECAANEYESTQLILHPAKAMTLDSLQFSDLKNSTGKTINAKEFKAYHLEYQTVNHAAAVYAGENRIADKMVPITGKTALIPGENTVLHLTFRAPAGTAKGTYNGSIVMSIDGKKLTVPVALKVWGFELPKENPFRAYGLLWNSPQSHRLATLKRLSECAFAGSTNYGGQRELRQCFDGKELKLPDGFETARKAVTEYGMNAFQAPYMFLGAWDWKPGKKVQFLNLDPESAQFNEQFTNYFKSFHRQVKEKGLLAESFTYMWDEVTAPHYPLMRRTIDMMRRAAPGLKVMTVGAPDPEVVELNDIITTASFPTWWGKDAEKIIVDGRKKGKEFWVYLNGESFVTDAGAIVPRLAAWRCRARGLSGYLQWSMDYRWNDQFERQGHVWLLYPTKGEPITAVRLENFRDGVEDYRYMELIKKLPESEREKLEREITKIAPAYGATSLDPVLLRDVRRKIAAALEKK